MTEAQKLEIRASEIRIRLSELGGSAELSDDTRAELDSLRTEYQDNERRQTALSISGAGPVRPTVTGSQDAAARELRELTQRANLGVIFDAVLEHRQTQGAERELQDHYNLGGNQVPVTLLETRDVTQAPSDVGQNQSEIIPGVFPQSCAAWLGIQIPTVPVGDSVYPVLTQNATVATPAEGADVAETTGSFSADVLTPARLQASFFYSREDRARFAGMDEALRMNLSDALADGLDKQILAGANGLFTGTNLANHAAAAVSTFPTYRADLVYGRIDGTYASMESDLRVVVGSSTLAHMATVYQTAQSSEMSALDSLRRIGVTVKVSAHVPAVSGNKQNALIRRGQRSDMVACVWSAIDIIFDEISKAKSGEIILTAVMLHAVKILRADGFYKLETQHA